MDGSTIAAGPKLCPAVPAVVAFMMLASVAFIMLHVQKLSFPDKGVALTRLRGLERNVLQGEVHAQTIHLPYRRKLCVVPRQIVYMCEYGLAMGGPSYSRANVWCRKAHVILLTSIRCYECPSMRLNEYSSLQLIPSGQIIL